MLAQEMLGSLYRRVIDRLTSIMIDALRSLIDEKMKKKGKRIIQDRSSDDVPKGSNVVDLMAALKKSIDSGARSTPAKKKAAPKKAPAKKSAPARKRA